MSDRRESETVRARIARWRAPLGASLAHLRPFILASTGLFVASAVAGFLLIGPGALESIDLADAASMETAPEYFVRNAGSAVGLMGGMGVLTVGLLAYNGFALGVVLKVSLLKGLSPTTVAAALVPHSVVEIPALLVAGGIGLFLPYRLVSYLRGNREAIATPEDEAHLAQLFVVVVLAILVAAVVEANLTQPVS